MCNLIFKYLIQLRAYVCFIIIFFFSILSIAHCQDNLNSITTSFNNYNQNTVKEKIYVHTDKSFYVAGEILWFKVYDVDASTHIPLELSKVAYVEILDSANKHVLQAKISLKSAGGNGSFYLPINLNSGNYKLRAYTNWMKNFSVGYFFEKNITIVNIQKNPGLPVANNPNKFDITFFPEGGNLVENIPCKIAFKGTDQFGKGLNFKGFLIDNTDTLLSFAPQHAGIGFFEFTPLANHTYKAIIQNDSGRSIVKAMPSIYQSGYVMHLSDSTGKIIVTVQSDTLSGREIYLFAHTRGTIKVADHSVLQNGKALFIFDKEKLGDGISQVTIFNDQKQPVCERLYFKKPLQQLEIKINTDQTVSSTRKKIDLHVAIGDTKLKDDTASLSMTVFKLDSLQSTDGANISSYLLLTSDISGNIEDPNYYFANHDAARNQELDNIMLTNGWRRFKWEEILQNKKAYFDFVPEYNGPIVIGKVINTITGKPAANIESYISVTGFQTAFNSSLSDNNGLVKFEMNELYGASEIVLQTNTMRDSIYRIDITDPYSNSFSTTPLPAFNLISGMENSLRQQSVSMQVQNIYTAKKLKQFIQPNFDTTAFYINPDAKYLLDNYTRFATIEEVLREYVAMTDVRKREGNSHFDLYNYATNLMIKSDPLVMLDGVAVFDFNKFMELDPLKLYKVEVLNRRYFLGNSIFNGIINWTSYKGDMAGFDPGPHATIIDYDGLQTEREFYSPSYATDEQRSSHLPDFRNVLQWSPNIKINPGAGASIDFYTSDVPGKYKMDIQGITKNGTFGHATFIFEVKR